MRRAPVALLIGLVGFLAYLVGVVTLADRVTSAPWFVQAVYFLVAGTFWAVPALSLIRWAARR